MGPTPSVAPRQAGTCQTFQHHSPSTLRGRPASHWAGLPSPGRSTTRSPHASTAAPPPSAAQPTGCSLLDGVMRKLIAPGASVLDSRATLPNTAVADLRSCNYLKDQRPTTQPGVLARSATPYNTVPAISRSAHSERRAYRVGHEPL